MQLDFWDQDIALHSSKLLYRIDETAKVLEVSNQQVRNLADTGELEGVAINSALDPGTERRHIRITRRSIENFINTRRRSV